jgi:WD40 repeat protein
MVSSNARSTAEADWWEKTLQHSFLELKSGLLSADISPDDRFVAIYATDSEDFPNRRKDESVYELQIWDWRAHRLVSRKVVYRERPIKNLGIVPRFIRYTDGGSKLVVYQEGHLLIINSNSLDQIQDIDIEMSQWLWVETRASRAGIPPGRVADLEVDFTGRRAAILIPWGVHTGGELRVYDLGTGKVLRRWEYPSGVKEGGDYEDGLAFYSYRPIAISPDGKTVAISMGLIPPDVEGSLSSEDRNVLILDVDSGQTTAAINTGYLTGPIRFVPGDPLALATVSEQSPEKGHKNDSIKIWNARSGALIREIGGAPEGARYDLDVSADGRVVMSYTTHLKYDFSWLGNEYGAKIFDYRVRLWDLKTGDEIATSPNLLPYFTGNTANRFRLSSTGRFVLMYSEFFRVHEAPTGRSHDAKSRYKVHFFELR